MQPKLDDDASAAVSSAAGATDTEADTTTLKRLLEAAEERRRWTAIRNDIVMRKKNLLKLLELQAGKSATVTESNAQREKNEAEAMTREAKDVDAMDTAALARKKELQELQMRAGAAKKTQQMAASVLARNLKQLQVKRKRDERETHDGWRKRDCVARDGSAHIAAAIAAPFTPTTTAIPDMPPFATAPDLDVGTPELTEAACFRIATRHLMQTGLMISSEKLKEAFAVYTGKILDESMDSLVLDRCLVSFDVREPRHTSWTSIATKCVPWQPGRQSLEIPTFISSSAARIQSLIDVEKEVVAAACNALQPLDVQEPDRSAELIRRHRHASFMETWLASGGTTPTLSVLLCASIGVHRVEPTIGRSFGMPNRSNGQIADVFDDVGRWLREQAETTGQYSNLPLQSVGLDTFRMAGASVSSKYAKPFSVENESIVRQLRGAETANASTLEKTIDPMKILCHYELNGACNDENCSNYHQKDYKSVGRSTSRVGHRTFDGSDTKDAKQTEPDHLLLSFAELRGKLMKKWPLISTQTLYVAIGQSSSGKPDVPDVTMSSGTNAMERVGIHGVRHGEDADANDDNFIALEKDGEPLEAVDARYFRSLDSGKAVGDKLVENVENDPNNPAAWLLLAIYQLDLDGGVSDEIAQQSDNDRLHQQLVFLSTELDTNLRGGASHVIDVGETNLKRCLHTLSRGLEVEANAYCEALWLLYLCLCKQVTNKQTQLDMAEQAVQFLPNSHALWLRYVTTYDFDSVGMAEEIYWRLLAHLAQDTMSTEDGQLALKPTPTKQRSILLAAICFHLCIKLWNAGATSRVVEILSALLEFGNTSSDLDCCSMIRGQLRSEELVVFCLAFAHVLLFNELPELIEHWVVASSDEDIPVKGMAYSLGLFERACLHKDEDIFARVLAAYDLAYQTFEKECDNDRDTGNVILVNWMLALAHHDDRGKNKKTLQTFFEQKLDAIQQFPDASLIAAKLMGSTQTGKEQGCQLMVSMMSQSLLATFPEALHRYLSACRQFPELVDALNDTLANTMERLAGLLGFDVDEVKKSFHDIMYDTNSVCKLRAQKALLDGLLAAWVDKFGALQTLNRDRSIDERPKQLAQICVALDICQLMGILLGPSAAIDGIQRVLSSSSFGAVSYEARQLAWAQRFLFQLDLLQRNKPESLPWREHQARLTRLLHKYMDEMSVEAELARQVSQYVRRDIARNAVDGAVRACLYPERHHLITFDVNLQLFLLCSSAVAEREQAAFYASFTTSLALSPDFSLAFTSIACHRWELLAARASLKKCLAGTKTRRSLILQALVAVEVRLGNMKAVSCLLQSEIVADPLHLETWRLIVGLEVLFGETLDARSKQIAEDMEKRQVVFTCNTFGDDKRSSQKDVLRGGDFESTSLNLRGLGLTHVPNAVLLNENLVSLDISGNKLTDLPAGLCRLQNLRTLNVSENALIKFPACVHGLTQLKELRLAHNNLTTVPLPELSHLVVFDVRWNAITRFPARASFPPLHLSVLQAEGNAIPAGELSRISESLSRKTGDASHGLNTQESMCKLDKEVEENGEGHMEMQTGVKFCESTSGQHNEACLFESTEVEMAVGDTDAASIRTERESGEDRATKQKAVDTTRKSNEDEEDQTSDNSVTQPKRCSTGQVVVEDDADTQSKQGQTLDEENAGGEMADAMSTAGIEQTSIEKNTAGVLTKNELTTASTAAEQSRETVEMDRSNFCEGEGLETLASDDHVAASNLTTEVVAAVAATHSVIDLAISDINDPDTAGMAKNDALAHDRVVSTVASERQSGHDGKIVTRRDLAEYMEQNHIHSRAEVRARHPALWRQFLANCLPMGLELPACRLCFAPNDGYNQRFNTTVLCVRCLEDALIVLKHRNENSNEAQEIG